MKVKPKFLEWTFFALVRFGNKIDVEWGYQVVLIKLSCSGLICDVSLYEMLSKQNKNVYHKRLMKFLTKSSSRSIKS